jgi:hypothetical protein
LSRGVDRRWVSLDPRVRNPEPARAGQLRTICRSLPSDATERAGRHGRAPPSAIGRREDARAGALNGKSGAVCLSALPREPPCDCPRVDGTDASLQTVSGDAEQCNAETPIVVFIVETPWRATRPIESRRVPNQSDPHAAHGFLVDIQSCLVIASNKTVYFGGRRAPRSEGRGTGAKLGEEVGPEAGAKHRGAGRRRTHVAGTAPGRLRVVLGRAARGRGRRRNPRRTYLERPSPRRRGKATQSTSDPAGPK